ncbi:trypsin-like serine protease [Vibrio sp. 10N.222.51.C8]|uniref:S1 family peptidase n=1 Tax=unclassified Vibrio TaxID=2614977 RepID=UPI000C824621|nr:MULTISPECIES: trypsin-like serine protease [unclassified Vibrio]PMK17278.1 serine protease [Vibrio sp. 10N.261.54.C3]PMO02184.1 serine protease [Vibrio sp. 10N.222.55.C12]PMO07669.1 serine protease [Vibrio sp. 10N.222.55.F9]PMO19564.1 serine protease [Vibrio sp. 10N.222.54.F10]PMO24916.1 serine protease [Vibrio sp. 10N.222.54.B6]
MNVNHTMSPVRKAVLGLLAPLIYTSSVMATENTDESTPDVGVTPYIVNGSDASVTEFPSMASLFIDRIDYDGVYSTGPYCGATILDNYHVLTAAHCIYGDENAQLFTVVVPQLEDTSLFPNGSIQKVRVSEVYYRTDYSNSINQLLRNDIAILKLEASLNLQSSAETVIPQFDTYLNAANDFVAVGHGDIETDVDGTTLLQQVDLTYVDTLNCKAVFGPLVTDKQICFNGNGPNNGLYGGTCQGDSGGPVFWKNGSTYEQVGITSFGPTTCGDDIGVTSVFTEVYDYKDWITDVTKGVNDSTETVQFTATEAKRVAVAGTSASTGSGSSGGGISFGLLGLLMLIAGVRKAVKR